VVTRTGESAGEAPGVRPSPGAALSNDSPAFVMAGATNLSIVSAPEDGRTPGELLPEPSFEERIRVMCRHLDLMVEVFGEAHGCRMFRKVAPWYSKRFGPMHEFNKRIVQVSSKAEFHDILENYLRWRQQFLDDAGLLKPQYRPAPLVASFMQEPDAAQRSSIPVPKGPVEVW